MSCSVKFAEAEGSVSLSHESSVVVRDMGGDLFAVNLGFLKHNHKYEICFVVDDRFGGSSLDFDPLQNLHVRVESVEERSSEDGGGRRFKLAFTAAKEKLMRETLTFSVLSRGSESTSPNAQSPILRLQINARVLGKDKGTPALKSGVKSVGYDADLAADDSEHSDWQGFE